MKTHCCTSRFILLLLCLSIALFIVPNIAHAADASDDISRFDLNNIDISMSHESSNSTTAKQVKVQNAEDRAEIENIVFTLNKYYLSSLFTSQPLKIDSDIFDSPEIENEYNAFIQYDIFNKPNAGSEVATYTFDVHFTSVEISGNLAKVVVNRKADVLYTRFPVGDPLNKNSFGQEEGYLLRKDDSGWKLVNIIFANIFVNDKFLEFEGNHDPNTWLEKYSFENCQRKDYEDTYNFTDYLITSGDKQVIDRSKMSYKGENGYEEVVPTSSVKKAPRAAKGYSKRRARAYALKYGANPNYSQYRYFGNFEGDCTNFVSQCIYHGGLPQTSGWYYKSSSSFSGTWVRVIELRDYLMNNGLARGYYEKMPDYPAGVNVNGTLIQFSNGKEWHHSAIVMGDTGTGYTIAEHTGLYGNTSSRNIGYKLDKTRTFWVGAG